MSAEKEKDLSSRWKTTVDGILTRVRKRARGYLIAGFIVYGGGSTVILIVVPDKSFALLLQMFLFQLCVLYFAVDQVFQCIRGSFEVMLENTRETMPVFDQMNSAAESLTKMSDEAQDGRAKWVTDWKKFFREEMDKLREDIRAEKGRVEGELGDALEEGEREAEQIRHGSKNT